METVSVRTKKPYEVRVANGLLAKAGEELRGLFPDARVMIVTDDTVDALYAHTVEASLSSAGIRYEKFVFPHGESSKCAAVWLSLVEQLAEKGFTRTDVLLALGGGVVGDLTGFAAATYQRGIPFIGIPTTLLAMVDSSVGGKTAIDLAAGKNLCGAFHQPALVLCDPDTLTTLPAETFADGMAEVIKYGVIRDADLFALLQKPDALPIPEILRRCIEIKAQIVEADEFDRGQRKLLNFGHTAGHAVESGSGFTLSHGRCVAIGMMIAAGFAESRGLCAPDVPAALEHTLRLYGLPTKSPYETGDLLHTARRDKKREGDTVDVVLPQTVGECVLHRLPIEELSAFLKGGTV